MNIMKLINKATAAYDRANLAETQADYDRDIAEYFQYTKEKQIIFLTW
jgi:hypothetical protein